MTSNTDPRMRHARLSRSVHRSAEIARGTSCKGLFDVERADRASRTSHTGGLRMKKAKRKRNFKREREREARIVEAIE
jgi:hypothetical protein